MSESTDKNINKQIINKQTINKHATNLQQSDKPAMDYQHSANMTFDSRSVTSTQQGLHENLENLVLKHRESTYKKPYQEHSLKAFDEFLKIRQSYLDRPLILDSCCGTALSSITLAEQHPDHIVIGIDQSEKRLSKAYLNTNKPDNCYLIRTNCEDFWRLCLEHQIRFAKHYILYPNPWPKSAHLGRRWHGHPVFPCLTKLAPKTILRSNWKVYLEEFSLAWKLVTNHSSYVTQFKSDAPLTLFEKKYHLSQQALYELTIDMS